MIEKYKKNAFSNRISNKGAPTATKGVIKMGYPGACQRSISGGGGE